MNPIFILLAVIATANAALHSSEYLPPLEDASPASNADLQSIGESSLFADDGYRYKTVKRLRFRHRRDVNELPLDEYLPPTEIAPAVVDIPVVIEESAALSDDGYHYKTIRRIRYRRRRRDVNELLSHEYLPPGEEIHVLEETAPLVDDGYHYKTARHIIYRRRF